MIALSTSTAHAGPEEYSPTNTSWNGLSSFVSVARGISTVETPTSLDLSRLTRRDAIVVVYPQADLPLVSLSSFLRSGGRVALVDDYGAGDELLQLYGITRGDAQPTRATPLLRNNGNLPLAHRRLQDHPLTDGVTALVTNHPRVVWHRELRPVFAFDDSAQGVVLAGVVGEGRLVTMADPSILINNMLESSDNRRFAGNLVRYLQVERPGTLYILGPESTLTGLAGDRGAAHGLSTLSDWATRFAEARLPPLGLQIIAAALVAILLVITFGTLPRRSPYDSKTMFPAQFTENILVQNLRLMGRQNNLGAPLLLYKSEIEAAILRHLGLRAPRNLSEVLAAGKSRGLPNALLSELRQLFVELDSLEREAEGTFVGRMPRATFHRVVDRGERLLLKLEHP